MVQINDDYYEDLTPESFNKLLDDLAAGRPVKIGPQSERHTSEPEGEVKTLQDPALFDGSLIGSWRKRFEEEAARKATEEKAKLQAEADEKMVASEPKPAKPDAGRATERPVADAPAQRVAAKEEPVSAEKVQAAADPATRTTVDPAATSEKPAGKRSRSKKPAPGDKS
jgi:NADH-quinone oxidoreductase subunit E